MERQVARGGTCKSTCSADRGKHSPFESQRVGRVVLDPLTGLPNRILLMDRLESATRRLGNTSQMLAVLFVDLDHFKTINDSLGHDRGDELLVAIAERLRAGIRDGDTVARLGGDEFVLLMDQVADGVEVVQFAQRVLRLLAAPVQVDGREITSSASIGIATATDPGTTPQALLRDADAAMYRAKERGRNRFELFDDGMRVRALDRLELVSELRRGIDDGQLRLLYQPIVSLADEQTVGFEALARWQHPNRGLLGPADFIGLAEETGLIGRVGEIVLHEALHRCGKWLDELGRHGGGRRLTMSVNLSALQMTNTGLPEMVAAALAQHCVPAEALCLEITESALMVDSARVRQMLRQLRGLGVSIALDDFGTGYSSLLYLREFPVDILKLDRFFVAGLEHNQTDRAIAASVMSLATALDMRSVGEGVENTEQREILRDLGCNLAQGYLWDRPLSAADASARLGLLPPLIAESLAAPPASPVSAVGISALTPLTTSVTPHVVLVDDNTAERKLLAHSLEDVPQFTVVGQASSGEDGVAVAVDTQPDVLLLDLSMPGLDGVRALPLILKAAPNTRVVILSGYISGGVNKMVLAAGAVACLDKNVGIDRFPLELLKALGGSTPPPIALHEGSRRQDGSPTPRTSTGPS